MRRWWIIDIGTYGDFAFYGTKLEAEEMRLHKSEWEGGEGTKIKADPSSKDHKTLIDEAIASVRRRLGSGYPMEEREVACLKQN